MRSIKPLKRFGQNYLIDDNILNNIVNEINPTPEDFIIEIGPGLGALTKHLYELTKNITLVEIDSRVVDELSIKFPELEIFHQDFLKLDLNEIAVRKNTKIRITGNIPYNITSQILFKLLENNNVVIDAVLMMQYEVAQRLRAKRGTKDYGILAVIMQYFTDINFCFKVSPNVFYPKPNVNSALIHINFNNLVLQGIDKSFFIKTVKAAFGNRRKTLKNSLSNSIFGNINFNNCGIDLTLRAEQLSIKDFLILAEFVKNNFPKI